jgi:heat shock protein HslJ
MMEAPMRTMLLALSLVLTPLAACESVASPGAANLEQAIEGRTWLAVAIAGADVIPGTRITLKIENGRVSGKAGCNSYGGGAEIRGDTVKFGSMFSTKMACMADGVMAQERRYLYTLQSATTGEVRDGTLLLSGAGGVLEFQLEK